MKTKDAVTRDYLSQKDRFAQLCNNELFGGGPVIDPDKLQDFDIVSYYAKRDRGKRWKEGDGDLLRQRDAAKLHNDKMLLLIIGMENQTGIHYAMPLRVLVYDTVNYEKQRLELANRHKKKKDLRGAEFVSGFSKQDRLIPIVTLVVYYGTEEWDGPKELHEMLNLPPELEIYKHLIGNYKINLLEIHSMKNLDQYTGEMKALFGFIKYQKDREKLNEFVQDNEEVFRSVSMETAYAIKVMAGAGEIENYIKQEEEEVTVDMCQALQDMMAESREKGYQEGELRKLIELICKKLKRGKSLETITQELEEEAEVVAGILEAAKEFGPEYDYDTIFKKLSIQ